MKDPSYSERGWHGKVEMTPGVISLLNAVDRTMNSNSMLLKVRAGSLLTAQNYRKAVTNFLQSALFIDMVLEWDRQRGRGNYTRFDGLTNSFAMKSFSGTLVKETLQLTCTPMTEGDFAGRIHWMLRTAFSPYQTHVSEQEAQNLIKNFFGEIFAPESWPLATGAARQYWKTHLWCFYDIVPDFLESTNYFGQVEMDRDDPFAYFDGGENDSCTLFYQGDFFYLLFTNGSP